MSKKKKTYLDYAATTPVDQKVFEKMTPFFNESYGNPSSIHRFGQEALFAVDDAREEVARFLNCKPEEVVFTGSATESNNLAIKGLTEKILKERKIHIITSKIEHDAVLSPIKSLEKRKDVSVTYLSVNKKGIIDIEELRKEIKKETTLVSIIYANNEIGTIQPIKEIGEIIDKENSKRNLKEKIFFHSDAVQAANYLDCRVDFLKVDMLGLSGHKIYGPKGVGVFYLKRGTVLNPIIRGGGQESGLRSGTENVPGIIGIGEAIKLIKKRKEDNKRIRRLRDKLVKGVLENIENVKVNGCLEKRIPNNVNFSFKGAEGESIVMALDQQGFYVSTGSACSSKSLEPSHVLMAIGLSREEAHCSLRISLGKETQEKDISKLIKILPDIVQRLRKISGRQ